MDCIISGISLYSKDLLLVLAYCNQDDEAEAEHDETDESSQNPKSSRKLKSSDSVTSSSMEPSGGIRRRQNSQPPELRLIDLTSQAEVDKDGLSVSRYGTLSSGDYHMSVLPAQNIASSLISSRGTLEALTGLGTDMWNAAINPKSLFSSAASIMSKDSDNDGNSSKDVGAGITVTRQRPSVEAVHPALTKPGPKIFIHSPYDCILASQRDLGDHLAWILERQEYERAWELLDQHPEIVSAAPAKANEPAFTTPSKHQGRNEDFPDDSSVAESTDQSGLSLAANEKRRVGEMWIQQLIDKGDWPAAGRVCGKVLGTPDRWEKWVWTFAGAKRFDEITDYIPSQPPQSALPSPIYEVILGHYLQTDKPRFKGLLERWSPDLFDINTITTALENQIKYRDVRQDSVENGERGRDWRIVIESLAMLHEANGRYREALKCYIKLHDADSAFRLIRDSHLAEAVADDIPSFIELRVVPESVSERTQTELQEATSEAITLLVDGAPHGLVRPQTVVEQLQAQNLSLYTFFYLRSLWLGEGIQAHNGEDMDRLLMDSQLLVDEFADLAVQLFAMYDRELLMEYLKTSTSYAFEKVIFDFLAGTLSVLTPFSKGATGV